MENNKVYSAKIQEKAKEIISAFEKRGMDINDIDTNVIDELIQKQISEKKGI